MNGTPLRRTARKRILLLVVAAAAAAIDLTTKALVEARLTDTFVDLKVLELRLTHNDGVAFSMGDALPTPALVTVTAVVTAAMALYGWRQAPAAAPVLLVAGGAIIGGAAANVIDRARDGAVTDYLHTGWWPTFNLADTFLVTGIALLWLGLFKGKPDTPSSAAYDLAGDSSPSPRKSAHE